jgi:hypothetical protein
MNEPVEHRFLGRMATMNGQHLDTAFVEAPAYQLDHARRSTREPIYKTIAALVIGHSLVVVVGFIAFIVLPGLNELRKIGTFTVVFAQVACPFGGRLLHFAG